MAPPPAEIDPVPEGLFDWPLIFADAASGILTRDDFAILDGLLTRNMRPVDLAAELGISKQLFYYRSRKLSKYFTIPAPQA